MPGERTGEVSTKGKLQEGGRPVVCGRTLFKAFDANTWVDEVSTAERIHEDDKLYSWVENELRKSD